MNNRTQAKRAVAILTATLLSATALSSWATQDIAARLGHNPVLGAPVAAGFYQPFEWIEWQRQPWADQVPRAFLPLRLGLPVLMVAGGGIILAVVQRRTNRPVAYKEAHGTAKFATEAEVQKAGLIGREGLYIGAWASKSDVHYLRHDGPEHVSAIAPTRSGKGVGLVIPNLLSFTGSAVVLDEKGELWQVSSGWRKSIGQTVFRWQPGHPTNSVAFNFLAEVRLRTGQEVADAQNVAVMIIDPEGKGFKDHWDRTAFGLLFGVILHVMYLADARGEVASLADVGQALSDPSLPADDLYEAMATNTHLNGRRHNAIAAAGQTQRNRAEKERSSVLSTVVTYMELFADPVIADNTNHSDFAIRDLMDAERPVSLYIVLPGSDKVRLRPLARLMLTMIVRGAIDVPITFDVHGQPLPPHKHRALWMFDEFPSFGRLAVFEDALAKIAGFGVTAFLISQDREQLIAAYGQNETILSNCGVQVVYAPNRWETAQWISRLTGESTVNLDLFSESGKRGGWLNNVSHSIAQIGRPLMTADEVMRLPGPTKDGTTITSPGQMLVFASKLKIKCRQILYFEDKIFSERAEIPPPVESDSLAIFPELVDP
jgi:type IV secretion system protein VirD4